MFCVILEKRHAHGCAPCIIKAERKRTMDPTILTTVGTAVTMMGGLLAVIARLKADLKQDIGEVKTDLKEVKADLEKDIREVKADLEKDIRRVETNLTTEINRVETNLTTEINRVETNLTTEINRVEDNLTGDIRRVDDRVWQLGTIIINHTGLPPDDIPLAPERQPTERNPVNA